MGANTSTVIRQFGQIFTGIIIPISTLPFASSLTASPTHRFWAQHTRPRSISRVISLRFFHRKRSLVCFIRMMDRLPSKLRSESRRSSFGCEVRNAKRLSHFDTDIMAIRQARLHLGRRECSAQTVRNGNIRYGRSTRSKSWRDSPLHEARKSLP